jgi:hypothetical protein
VEEPDVPLDPAPPLPPLLDEVAPLLDEVAPLLDGVPPLLDEDPPPDPAPESPPPEPPLDDEHAAKPAATSARIENRRIAKPYHAAHTARTRRGGRCRALVGASARVGAYAQVTSCINALSGRTRRASTTAPPIDVHTKSMK